MHNFCLLISTLFVGISLKSACSAFVEDNQSRAEYKLRRRNEDRDSRKLSNEGDEESWFESYRSSDFDDTPSTINEYRILTDGEVRSLLNRYYNDRRRQTLSEYVADREDIANPTKFSKRALTMLSRWKPFRIPNKVGGNGRHVIRSPFNPRSDPSHNKMQIMGRPFRWG